MAKNLSDILTREEIKDLHEDVMECIGNGGSYEDVEDIMLGYGVEMDYIENLLF